MRYFHFHTNGAGLFSISWDGKKEWEAREVHFFPKRENRMWGKHEDWYDGQLYYFGLGPFLLICWT